MKYLSICVYIYIHIYMLRSSHVMHDLGCLGWASGIQGKGRKILFACSLTAADVLNLQSLWARGQPTWFT